MFIILIAVVLGIIWLWAALLYGKVAFKVLRWFVRELIATPAAVARDIRRLRGLPPRQSRKAQRIAKMWQENSVRHRGVPVGEKSRARVQ